MMLGDPEIPQRAHRTLMRMQHAGRDMEAIIDAFLILARENEHAPLTAAFDLAPLVDEDADQVRPLPEGQPAELTLVGAHLPPVPPAHKVRTAMRGQVVAQVSTFSEPAGMSSAQ